MKPSKIVIGIGGFSSLPPQQFVAHSHSPDPDYWGGAHLLAFDRSFFSFLQVAHEVSQLG